MTPQLPTKDDSIQPLDFIRGLALLGILLIHSQPYSLVGFLRLHSAYALPLDRADSFMPAQLFIHLLVNGPFCGLFSVGFGWSFYRWWQLNQQAGLEADRIARRYLWRLLALGLMHGLVVGFGELLHHYALLGFTLLYFSKQSIASLLRWIAGLAGLGVFMQLMQFLIVPLSSSLQAASGQPEYGLLSELVTPWRSGSWQHPMGLQPVSLLTRAIGQGLAPYIHGEILLLVGLILGKMGPFYRLAKVRVRLSLLLVLIFPVAILLKIVSSLSAVVSPLLPARWQSYQPLLFSLGDFLGTPLLTLVYLVEIGLNARSMPTPVVVWISQVGRMSLTNYLLQSGLSTLLFYEDGLGLSGKLSLLQSVGMVFLTYSLQLWFSHWWLRHYPQGPVEQLLHRWTYGKSGVKTSAYPRIG